MGVWIREVERKKKKSKIKKEGENDSFDENRRDRRKIG